MELSFVRQLNNYFVKLNDKGFEETPDIVIIKKKASRISSKKTIKEQFEWIERLYAEYSFSKSVKEPVEEPKPIFTEQYDYDILLVNDLLVTIMVSATKMEPLMFETLSLVSRKWRSLCESHVKPIIRGWLVPHLKCDQMCALAIIGSSKGIEDALEQESFYSDRKTYNKVIYLAAIAMIRAHEEYTIEGDKRCNALHATLSKMLFGFYPESVCGSICEINTNLPIQFAFHGELKQQFISYQSRELWILSDVINDKTVLSGSLQYCGVREYVYSNLEEILSNPKTLKFPIFEELHREFVRLYDIRSDLNSLYKLMYNENVIEFIDDVKAYIEERVDVINAYIAEYGFDASPYGLISDLLSKILINENEIGHVEAVCATFGIPFHGTVKPRKLREQRPLRPL